jgi:cyclic pyranopterin phosphate synthase
MAIDRFGRNIHYLRVSLTDHCNLRCVYCIPEEKCFLPTGELLQDDEILYLIKLFASIGFDKYRLTGGEPTIRANIVDLVREIARIPGVDTLSMTTNGILLPRLAGSLAEAGLQRVNISLDTLDAEKYRRLTRWGNLDDVWMGIHAAEEAGLKPIKINSVLMGEHSPEDVVDLARLTLVHPWHVRFIEMMPIGGPTENQVSKILDADVVKNWIETSLGPMEIVNDGNLDGAARIYRFPKGKGIIGFIQSVTKPFCSCCTRMRLTADGKLRLCLLSEKEVDLITPIRSHVPLSELRNIILEGIRQKPWGHQLAQGEIPSDRTMSEIGG